MKVLMIAAEAVPFAKVGGLADVVGALPLALKSLGVDVRVILPKYRKVDNERYQLQPLVSNPTVQVLLGRIPVSADVYSAVFPNTEIPVYFIDQKYFFDRDGIYDNPATGEGFADNGERFCFFSKAAMELLGELQWLPDVLHCHDSQTALIPAYLKISLGQRPLFRKMASVLTIHNLGYQGLYPREILYPLNLSEDLFYPGGPIEFYNQVNFMKAGLVFADCLNTVSEAYAQEIQTTDEFGYGLQGVLQERSQDLFGIMNGIDYNIWNPEVDKLIPCHYSSQDLLGKLNNKGELLKRYGLDPAGGRVPLIGMISRLADQKGFDLVIEALEQLMELPISLIILGSGNRHYEEILLAAAARHPHKLSVNLMFDDPLAHLIEAGADMFLMPSKYEPCGLNQLYSLRYGTIPVVRATGGLRDSVQDADLHEDTGTGFLFERYSASDMLDAVKRAIVAYQEILRWDGIMQRAMAADFSWANSARKYLKLYQRAFEKRTMV
jgi:starch synthase